MPPQEHRVIPGNTSIEPLGRPAELSPSEIEALLQDSKNGLHESFRRCCLAVLNAGHPFDNPVDIFNAYPDFDVDLERRSNGVSIVLKDAPEDAFVDGKIMRGSREHLFAVLRDLVYVRSELQSVLDPQAPDYSKDSVFRMLRHAGALESGVEGVRDRIVCWGGHSIPGEEYDYSKEVGYELALRDGVDIITGSGPGIMKGPMKGAHIGHQKQRIYDPHYLGFSEPGIIMAEAPNAMVNRLVIFPNIEQRLEAFVRASHGIMVFPGGAGTAEEIQYILGVLLHPDNRVSGGSSLPVPVVLTGPESRREYFEQLDAFIGSTLGEEAQSLYEIVVGDPKKAAHVMKQKVKAVRKYRDATKTSYQFNDSLMIPEEFRVPFDPTHEGVAALKLNEQLHDNKSAFAADLRRAFSAIVAGNVKPDTVKLVKEKGNFTLNGSPHVAGELNTLLSAFARDGRMRLIGEYDPCYDVREA